MVDTVGSSSTSEGITNETVNSDHPLYLHQTDHPGLILISKDNYSSWKRSMVIAINAKKKMRLITCEFLDPNTTSSMRALWERNNGMVISWILNTVAEHIASKLWLELQELCAQIDGHRIYQISNDLVQLK